MNAELLNRNFSRLATLALSVFFLSGAVEAVTVMEDGFETGDLTASQNGFRWHGSTRTSISSSVARSGRNSLQFTYPAGIAFSEQRFALGGNYRDIWVSYDLLIPSNYYHGEGGNNKGFLYLWSGDYGSPTGPGLGPNFWPMGDGSSKASIYNWGPGMDVHHGSGTCINGVIKLSDRGKWIKIIAHYKYASSANNDGIVQIWKIYSDGTQEVACNLTNGPWYVAGAPGFDTGYLLGWANAAFSTDTYFYIDNFEVATHSLLTESTASLPEAPTVVVE